MNLTIVLPTLNEAGNILELTAKIWEAIPDCDIIVVDDGSTDDTQDRVREIASQGKSIRLIARTGRPCLTDSIWEGVHASRTAYVGWMDADLSHPPSLLPHLLEQAKITGCAIATRFAPGGSQLKSTRDTPDSFLAVVLSKIMNFVVKGWLGLSITDYTSGYIVCRRDLIADHRLVGDYGEYFIELMYYLVRSNVRVTEIPYTSPPRQWGQSKTGANFLLLIKRGVRYVWLSLRLRLPRKLFGKFSLAHPQSKAT